MRERAAPTERHSQPRNLSVVRYAGADVAANGDATTNVHFWLIAAKLRTLAVSGARWFAEKRADGRQQTAIEFVKRLADAPIYYIAIENPISNLSSVWRMPDQIIQPWQFGHNSLPVAQES